MKLLKFAGMPFLLLEENDIIIPVLVGICTCKYHVTFGDTVTIKHFVIEYS